jgi:transcriptional regulator with XRE-family HTH domain
VEKIMISIEAVSRFRWNQDLGEKLKILRTNKKISRAALVTAMAGDLKNSVGNDPPLKIKAENLSLKYIQRLENGESDSIALEALQSIAIALDVSIDELLGADQTLKNSFTNQLTMDNKCPILDYIRHREKRSSHPKG